MRPKVSIIIVTYNALPLLQACLPSVVATDYDNFEIVLADNASDDGSARWAQSAYPGIRVIRHPENWGFCRGNNEAIRRTEGAYVALLNNDVETPPGWLAPLVDLMERRPEVGAAGPKLLQHGRRDCFEYAGAAGGHLDRLGYPFTRGRIFETLEEDRGQYDDPADVFWVSGAAMMLRRSALGGVGLLDERFYMHMEEIDLCWRLQRAGWRIAVEPAAHAYHIGGASLPQSHPRKTYYNFRNSLLMLHQNLPASAWARLFPQRAALDAAAAARALAAGRPAEAQAIAKAYRDAHVMARKGADRAGEALGRETRPSYRGSIVLDYFARGRRRFSELPPQNFR